MTQPPVSQSALSSQSDDTITGKIIYMWSHSAGVDVFIEGASRWHLLDSAMVDAPELAKTAMINDYEVWGSLTPDRSTITSLAVYSQQVSQ